MFSLLLLMALAASSESNTSHLQNPGFESAANSGQVTGWELWTRKENRGKVQIQTDSNKTKEGTHALRVDSPQPVDFAVRQQIFLPVGSTWRVSAWVKGEDLRAKDDPREATVLEIETPVGTQARASLPPGTFDWQQQQVEFRVPSPGRVHIALRSRSSGKLWLDDVRLEPITIASSSEIHITTTRLAQRPIDLKQGGQFIEPLCHMIPSMLAQQVEGDSFEEEVPCEPSYKTGMDWPHRPWYPDGAVHIADFSYDTVNPYNGKRSQRIDLPLAHARAGISQDGFYLSQGIGYKLRLHMRGTGHAPVWATLRGEGGVIAGPVSLGRTADDWKKAEVLLRANKTTRNATLTIDFEGPGTVWLDRIYMIGEDAVLGLWRPDAVQALKAENPGMIRFGGSMIEVYEWDKSIGPLDQRVPYTTGPWGGHDPNFVGIEEITELSRYLGAEPQICIRWSDKTPEDAAAEVEYMNGSINTKWGKLRAENGHPEPYNVKYWQIGNEVGGSQYDDSVRAFAEAMRKVDSTIKILSSFPSIQTLSEGGGYLDYLCPHHYEDGDLLGKESEFKFLNDQIAKYGQGKDVRAAITEWNTTAGEMGLTRGILLTLGNALSNSRYQNLMHRYSDLVEIAIRSNLSDSFGSGMIQPGIGWMYLSPAYHAQVLYQRAAGSYPLRIATSSTSSWVLQEPDVSATLSPDGKMLRIYAINSTAVEESVKFRIDGFSALGGQAMVIKDRDNASDSEAMNTANDPERITTTSNPTSFKGGELAYTFAPFSVTLLEIPVQSR
jgi:alpha-N-arabinofuranosidase